MTEILGWVVYNLFLSPLFLHAYACEEPDAEHSEIVFSYQQDAASVFDRRVYVQKNPDGELTHEMPDGTTTVEIGDRYVEVKWLRDAVHTRVRLPSGEITESGPSFGVSESFANRLGYRAVIQTIETYTFDKERLQLSVHHELFFPARRVIEQKFVPHQDSYYPEQVRHVPDEEARGIFTNESDPAKELECRRVHRNYLRDKHHWVRAGED